MKFSYSLIKTMTSRIPAKAKFAEDLNLHSFETENLEGDTLDISLASNRYSDAASHLGIAREASAIYGTPLKNPVKRIVNAPTDKGFLKIKVKDQKFCPRYAARYFEIKKVGSSSPQIQKMLRACGLKPINAVVDIMNYAMLEVGQPLHAFDFDKVKSMKIKNQISKIKNNEAKAIFIRNAKKGERIEALDGQKFALTANDFVIADSEKALAIAGIKGGANSGVDGKTKRIIVEAANFDPVSIFKTSRRLKLQTDASIRFSHGLSPSLADWGMDRATELLVKMGAKLIDSADFYPKPAGDELITFDVEAYKQLIGAPVSAAEAQKYFQLLGFFIENVKGHENLDTRKNTKNISINQPNQHGSAFLVRIPPWRTDIERTEDLIEEIARLKGYNNLKSEPPVVSIRTAEEENMVVLKDRVRQFMIGVNLNEVYNYSFGPEGGSGAVEIENPLSKEFRYLRKSLEAGLLKNIRDNSRFFDEAMIFEIGKVFHTRKGTSLNTKRHELESAVEETLHLGVALGAKKKPLMLELKGLFDELLRSLGLADFSFIPLLRQGYGGQAHSASLRIESDHHVLGEMKTVHLEKSLPAGRQGWTAAVGELNLGALLPLLEEEREFRPLPKYPAVIRDISLLVSLDTRIGDVLEAIQDASPKLVEDVDLTDEYRDEKFQGKQSLTFRIVFQAEDRTLTDAEVNAEMEKISSKLKKDFRAETR